LRPKRICRPPTYRLGGDNKKPRGEKRRAPPGGLWEKKRGDKKRVGGGKYTTGGLEPV